MQDPLRQLFSVGDNPMPGANRKVDFLNGNVAKTFRRHPDRLLAAGILLLMAANLLSVAARKSMTNDEIVHIPAGYQYLVNGKFRLNAEHPPLVKMWACLPLLIIRPQVPQLTQPVYEDFEGLTERSAIDFWNLNRDRYQRILFWSRVPIVFLTLGLGVSIFSYARYFFGARPAVLALAFFSLDPTMLAFGHIVHTDIAAAFAGLVFLFSLQIYCRAPTLKRALILGVAIGFALLTKFSMVIVLPASLLAFLYILWKAPRLSLSRGRVVVHGCLLLLIVLMLINTAYRYQHYLLTPGDAGWIAANAMPSVSAGHAIQAIKVLSRIIPTYYLFGLYTVIIHNHFGHPASLLGSYSDFGWWYYFPVAFSLKSTLSFVLLSIAAVIWAAWVGFFRRDKKLIPLLFGLAAYMAFSMTSHINIGIRHIAPIFPLLFVLSGVFLDRLLGWRAKFATVLTFILLGSAAISAAWAYPNYLTFMNAASRGKPDWQFLSDSNVEWGEDVGEMAAYLKARGETKLVGSLSGGSVTPGMYGVELMDFAPPDIGSASTRYVAIGAGFLNGSTVPRGLKDDQDKEISEEQRCSYFAKYRTMKPEAIFGNSIYLYRAQ